ncbi:MAG: hypothetical protein A2784_04505 [Candidatus Chisholmbacteria bacterium RIFCSPHIGHO2_01_FULL_48_12]|uniref:Uncharacterized protein n=1 Tax=Candidatus Chisholmbacteria bacterium RIFCSPHIGHO2_01_FULL_48_12 TaxID=1797589 RepID=A0A1G1VJP3_9BACT|nr:MAG: hypothetical protein A2784_04505 [Candidatus Chisholmbacteria bacterium RIFCSPHIGHO2_01_FULL_48_12]
MAEEAGLSLRRDRTITPRLKKVEYKGFRGHNGEVAYQRRGNKVLFSAITEAGETTSTVNAAEAVVKAICEAEGVDWRGEDFGSLEFYDLMTKVGYPCRKLEDWEINRLGVVVGNVDGKKQIQVTEWIPVVVPESDGAQGNNAGSLSLSAVQGFIEAKRE